MDNIKFANTDKPRFLPFNSDGYYSMMNINDKKSQDEKAEELKISWTEKWESSKGEKGERRNKKSDYILDYIDKNSKFLQEVLHGKLDHNENIWPDLISKYKESLNKDDLFLIKSFFTEILYACDVKFED